MVLYLFKWSPITIVIKSSGIILSYRWLLCFPVINLKDRKSEEEKLSTVKKRDNGREKVLLQVIIIIYLSGERVVFPFSYFQL